MPFSFIYSSRILGLAYFIVLNEDQPMTFFFVKRFSKSRSWNDQAHDFAKFLTFLLDIFFNVVEFFIDTELRCKNLNKNK